jgi:aryl-alcohol dehydrogenase-like predicted oxidoreductase
MNSSENLRPLGKSDLMVTPIGLGCWQFSKRNNMAGKFWPTLDDAVIRAVVKTSLEGGINWFDTAEVYGSGASEKALSAALTALGKKPGEVMIATKWWPMFRFASSIVKTIGNRLDALSPFPIDLYQVHQPFGFSSEKEEMEAMAKLVKAKKIRYVGVSNFSAAKMRSAWETLQKHGIALISNQVRYSLLDRKIESNGLMETAKELGITIIAYSPLAQGILTGKFHDNPELLSNIGFRKYSGTFKPEGMARSKALVSKIKDLAVKYNVTPSQIALNWLIHFHGNSVVAIPGATKESHARENTGVLKFQLSREDMEMLDRESLQFRK